MNTTEKNRAEKERVEHKGEKSIFISLPGKASLRT